MTLASSHTGTNFPKLAFTMELELDDVCKKGGEHLTIEGLATIFFFGRELYLLTR